MFFSEALTPRRIARSLVTVLALTFIQTVLPTIAIPQIVTPKAEAVTNTYSPAQATEWLVPANVTQISVTIKGGSGGVGGQDCGLGCNNQAGGPRGSLTYAFTVSPGDVVGIYPGNKGTNGLNSTNAGGGSAGADTSLNGTFDGGAGGGAGIGGFSGAGGGGGAASVLLINSVLRAVAGGAGGGGGAANVASSGRVGVEYAAGSLNGTSFTGGNGGTTSSCTTTSGGTTNDGGGSGGSGGGYYGGAAMAVYAASAGECAGNGGVRGGNYIFTNAGQAVIGNTGVAQGSETVANTDGSIVIDYTPGAISTCTETPQTVDIYRVIKISTVGGCTWAVPAGVTSIDLFAVGGGGAGGAHGGSGGGGGAAISRTALAVTASTNLTVKIGYGGSASFTDGWSGGTGDSTTISFPSGLLLSANGGSMGVKGVGATAKAGGAGGTAGNGGFAGGAGGVGATTVNSRGAVGKTGISNYFLGTLNQFGGGGGGGTYKDGCTPLDGQLGSSGGAAGASCSSNTNSAGGSALAETGGGGGGGGYGTSGNTLGGKGGSGVVYLRYTLNAADAFPSTLSSALAGRYSPGDLQILDSSRKGWIDSSGTNATVSDANITSTGLSILNQGVTDGGVTTGSTKSLLTVRGTVDSKITFQNLNTGYTLFNVARYVASGTNRRIFTARDVNWLSGFYYGVRETHHNAWLTDDARVINTQWLLSTDQAVAYRANGIDVADNDDSIGTQLTSAANFGINNWVSGDTSDFQVSDVLIFNRELTMGEIRLMETYLSRINGLTLSPYFNTSETDTAYTATATYSYFFGQQDVRNNLNDTFTVEAWLRPDAYCNTNVCTYFAREASIRLVIRNGLYEFILFGDGNWEWVPTGVAVKSGEWQHVAISKTLRGNRGDSVKLYINGQLAYTKAGSPYRLATSASTNSDASTLAQVNTWSYIGVVSGGGERWRGEIDEFKIWKVARTQAEILSDMHSNDGSSPSMQAYYDMNFVPGVRNNEFKIPNLAYGGHGRSDLFNWTADTLIFNDVKTVTTSGPYTTIKFPRTYITQSGGWKVPESVTAASTIVVGGGGGSGKSDSKNSAPAGAGGGGGVTYVPVQSFNPSSFIPVTVGVGGLGATAKANDASDRNGQSSYLGVGAGLTALGGGGGGSNNNPGAGGSTVATGGGGGGSLTSGSCAALGPIGGTVPSGYNGAQGGWGWGGLGGSARGAATTSGCYGIPGDGFIDPVTNVEYGHTGNNQFHSTWSVDANYTTPNNGWGGSVSYGGTAIASGAGISGSAGTVIIRYITATRPNYTKPTTAYLNLGMTETFTTNIAVDSATVGLTRTFRWESTTAGSGGTFTTIKQGTGATNASFSWNPTDTSTTGSNYLYRLTVIDSDTAGLFITDSSTAFAVINGALVLNAKSTLSKTVNISKVETFTVTLGTPTYRYTFTNNNPLITLDTSTVGSPRIRIADTITVGTYYETFTVIDSVSATIVQPLTIVVSPPPSFSANGAQVDSGTALYLDAGNLQSNSGTGATWKDISGRGLTASFPPSPAPAMNGVTSGNLACTAPTFAPANLGILDFNGGQCGYVPNVGLLKVYTYEVWVKRSAAMTDYSAVISNPWSGASGQQLAISLHWMANGTLQAAIFDGVSWSNVANSPVINIGVWTHVAVTFSGSTLTMTLDGNTAGKISVARTLTWVDAKNDTGIIIGKRFDLNADYFKGSLGPVRIYNRVLTDAELLQNYNATKGRFLNTQNKQSIAGKYGTTVNETYTVTAGSETITAVFTSAAVAGLRWDTSTVRSMTVQLQESLTAGTYNDTITVTDIYGSSTRIQLTITVAKADTITVTMDTATVTTFNDAPITVYPKPVIKGLVNSDTATVTTKFSSASYSLSASPPTNSDTYTVTATDLTMLVGSLNNYLGVVVETSTARINKARQAPLIISTYTGFIGSSFTITVLGGTGGGAISETFTGLSTAPNCQINNGVLTSSATTNSYCQLQITKAESQNYFAESITALIYFIEFVFNQPAPAAGSGPNVALTGESDVTVDIDLAPMISSLSTYAAIAGVTSLLINGIGFNGSDPLFELKFWRGIAGTGYTINPAKTQITVTVPAGTRTGKVTVITSKGLAVSEFALVITP